MSNLDKAIFDGLPVAELHCHLEATVLPDEAKRLAARHGLDISGVFGAGGAFQWRTFEEFLHVYDAVSEVVRTAEDYHEISLDYFQRMAAKGMIYGEVFVSPAHAGRFGVTYGALIDAVASAIEVAQAESGIVGRIVVTCVRHFGAEHALAVARTALNEPHPFVTGFGMAGDEAFGAAKDFKRAFDVARDAGLGLTTHAGEVLGPQSVRDAIALFNVARIGHGVRAIDDKSLIAEIIDRGITLEVCPSSNIAIGVYPSLAEHPLPKLIAAGVNVTLNADDPSFFGADVVEEYQLCAETFGFTRETLLNITRTAIDAAFCDDATKLALRARLL